MYIGLQAHFIIGSYVTLKWSRLSSRTQKQPGEMPKMRFLDPRPGQLSCLWTLHEAAAQTTRARFGDQNRTRSKWEPGPVNASNILYEHVEPYHLVIKIVVNWTAQVLLNLNCFQTQPRALNLSYAGTPDGNPSRAALSSSWTFWASVEASSRSFAWVTRSTEGRFGPPRVISSLRLSRVESSTSRKGFPAPSLVFSSRTRRRRL